MKRIFLLLVVAFAFASCAEDVKFNDPSLQAMNGEKLFRALAPRAIQNPDGTISLEGEYRFEELQIKVASAEPGTYLFGVNTNTVANYSYKSDGMILEYSTLDGITNPNMQDNLGEITIYEADNPLASKEPGTISGVFKFNAKLTQSNPFGQSNVFLQQGHFYGLKFQTALPEPDNGDTDIDEAP
ncbi:MAG TPA: DUF6252 family protein [Flavobacterium sp.]|nr:DUF6252 family protein [Flavobacterium sp.]